MTRAARRLQLAQPALSQAIARLESQVGVKLLERNPRGVAVTPAGEAFLEKAQATLDALDQAQATARSWARAEAGRFQVGFLSLTPPMMAGELFDRFSREHPELNLEWRELGYPTHDALAWLGDTDVALMWMAPTGPGLRMHVLRTSPLVAAVGERHHLAGREKVTVREILDEPFPGVVESCDRGWLGHWGLDRHRGGPARRTEDRAASPTEMASIVASGRALTTVPEMVALPFHQLGIRSIPIVDADPAELVLVWREMASSPLVDDLVTLARELTAAGEPAL
jgi:DNA-binding transcriptional LysR family regulator